MVDGRVESEEDKAESGGDNEEGCMVNAEMEVPGAIGRVLVQFELAPQSQRLTFSLISLDLSAVNLGEATLRYTFAVGLTSAYLLDAESLAHGLPYFEFAEWRGAERGALSSRLPKACRALPPSSSAPRHSSTSSHVAKGRIRRSRQ